MVFRKSFLMSSARLKGEKSVALDLARGRLVMISAFFILAYVMVMARAFDLAVLQGGLDDTAVVTSAATQDQSPRRADIVDRNGVMLATTLEMVSLYADPAEIYDAQTTSTKLAAIFPALDRDDLAEKLSGERRFVWVKRNIIPLEQRQVLEIGEPGLRFEKDERRLYPHGGLAAHIVGYTDIDNDGLAGLERQHSKALARGDVLKTTLDVRLQHALRRSIALAIHDFDAQAGAGVILDIKTGEILAAVSLPDFDPHDAGNAPDAAKFNRLSLGVYELGSMFKIFSTAALLENYALPLSHTFDAREPIKMGRFTINDYHAEERELTIPEIFMHSSNIGTAKMGQMVGGDALKRFYGEAGLLDPLDIDFPAVGTPMVPNPWREINTLTASYGHGIAVSALQLAVAAGAVMNDGIYMRPQLVMEAGAKSPQSRNGIRIVSSQTADKMRAMMRLTVSEGTAANADVPGYMVGGKTGTAEKVVDGKYDRKKLISSFIGTFPMNDPRYAVLVMVDEPKGNKKSFGFATAGWVAAPAVARIVAAMGSILNIEPVQNVAANDIATPLKVFVAAQEEDAQ